MNFLNHINLALIIIIAIRIFSSEKEKPIFVIIYTSLFSVLCSIQYLFFNAPDVAITEVSVGACLTTIFIIRSITYTKNNQDENHLIFHINYLQFKKKYFLYFAVIIGLFFAFFSKTSIYFEKIGEYNHNIYNETIKYYIEQTKNFFNFPNIVTAILASFRGFDTLIETLVILTAGIGVITIFPKNINQGQCKTKKINYDKSIIINTISFIIPFMILFAFYIQAHGEESPGGGFQSGSILACAFIVYSLVVDNSILYNYLKEKFLLRLGAFGALLYFIIGTIPMFRGENFLNHNYLLCDIASDQACFAVSQKTGIFIAELGVGITVFAIMMIIFYILNEEREEGENIKISENNQATDI